MSRLIFLAHGRVSTDAAGVAECLGLQAETKFELETIVAELERISSKNRFSLGSAAAPVHSIMPIE
jgi:hypothetical protein